ncbi:stalk domain-containing protein [Heliomicrobium undosum]|nr:stalk domain-containing protein [Heliomicrobium undosum]
MKRVHTYVSAALLGSLLLGLTGTPAMAENVYNIGSSATSCESADPPFKAQFPEKANDLSLRVEIDKVAPERLTPVDTYYVTRVVDLLVTNRNKQKVETLSAKPLRLVFPFDEVDFKRASRMNTELPIGYFRIGRWDEQKNQWRELPSRIFWNGAAGAVEADTTFGGGRYALLWTYDKEAGLSDMASDKIRMMVDYEVLLSPNEPFLKDGRLMVPLRSVAQALGCIPYWDAAESRIDLARNMEKVSLWMGKSKMVKNGKTIVEEKPDGLSPESVDGTTFVPLRLVADAFGVKVSWDDVTRTVYILKN